MVLHTDTSLLPALARRAGRLERPRSSAEPRDAATVTYDMGLLQRLASPDADLLRHPQPHGARSTPRQSARAACSYQHPGVRRARRSPRSVDARAINGANRTHYCGAYWGYGFHEDGVRSALRGGCGDLAGRLTGWRAVYYEGVVRHVRRAPVRHAFSYRLAFLYLDLAELPQVFAGSRLFGVERPAPAAFWRADHLGDPRTPLDESVRARVEERTGRRPAGPIRLLTLPRVLGHAFNPISLYFCWDRAGGQLDAIVAEVTNTPWCERHCYVLDAARPGPAPTLGFRSAKALHVSPFLAMDYTYAWRIRQLARTLAVSLANERAGKRPFGATLALERRELTPGSLRRALALQLLVPARVVAAIHWQALRLWWKGVPVHAHHSQVEPLARATLAR